MTHLPLNGERLLRSAASALATPKPSAAHLIRSAIRGEDPYLDEDAPDGTGGATKGFSPEPPSKATEPRTAQPPKGRATDPSQGHGANHRARPQDPLTAALLRAVNR